MPFGEIEPEYGQRAMRPPLALGLRCPALPSRVDGDDPRATRCPVDRLDTPVIGRASLSDLARYHVDLVRVASRRVEHVRTLHSDRCGRV